MKAIEKKIGLSLLVHVIWFVLIAYACMMMEGGSATEFMEFMVLTDNVPKVVPLEICMAYIFILLIYFIKPLQEKKEKHQYWIFTGAFTLMIVVPFYFNYFS